LPPGVAIPVITDGDLPPAPGEGDCWVYVTLHELVEPLPRGSRSVLRVCLDGVVIGRLTPRMSAELLPAVRRLAAGHQLTAARGLRTASGSQPELIVHAARSHELPELWLDSIAPGVTAVAARPFAPQAAGEAEPGNARPAGTPAPLYSPPPVGIAASLHGSAVGTARNGDSVVDHGSAGHWDRIDASKPPAGLRRSAPVPGGRHDPGIEDGADGRRRLVPIRREAGPAPIANGVYRAAARTPIPADAAVPPPPAGVRFAAPPGWPPPPPGWTPPAGWRPDPAWPPAPADWQWWVPYWD
jgi:collagen type III alpha